MSDSAGTGDLEPAIARLPEVLEGACDHATVFGEVSGELGGRHPLQTTAEPFEHSLLDSPYGPPTDDVGEQDTCDR